MGCSRHGNFALANSDFVIVLGSSLNLSLARTTIVFVVMPLLLLSILMNSNT